MVSAGVALVGLPSPIAGVAKGARIGPYRVTREIGRGGMGLVYECVHEQLGKRVAIKMLRPHLLENESHVQRFLREGRAACQIGHPHVVQIHELGTHEGAPYLVMELLEGVHLGDRLASDGPLPLTTLVDFLLPILAAVSAAHAAGVVHRDLKPSNIMLARARDGSTVPMVLDFGTSKFRDSASDDELLTITGAVLGTPHYMSPEQTRSPRDADARSDQYSLGLILYECATGKKPFSGESTYDLMRAIMTAPLAAPSAHVAMLPALFDAVVLRAMSRRPSERFGSVAELGAALLPLASEAAQHTWQAELSAAAQYHATIAQPGADVDPSRDRSGAEGVSVSSTLPSASRLDRAAAQRTDRPARGGASQRHAWTALLISVVVVALWALTLRQARHTSDELAVQPSTPAQAAVSAAASAPVAVTTATTATPEPAAAAPEPAAVQSARASNAARKSAGAPRSAKHSVAPVRPASARPVALGDNGAPILE